jgi:transposase
MKHLSEDLKWRVVFHIADGYTQKESAERLYISVGTANKVYNIYKRWGCVIDPFCGNQGRKKTFNLHDMKVFKFI